MTAHEVTDKQIAEAAEARYPDGAGNGRPRIGFIEGARWALAARPSGATEDVAALVADARTQADAITTEPLRQIEVDRAAELLRRLAAALEVSSRTVAPNREALARIREATNEDDPDKFGQALDRIIEILDGQPALVIDRDALVEMLAGHIEAAQHPHHRSEVGPDALDEFYLATVAVDALLPFIGQPASPRTVTTVEERFESPHKEGIQVYGQSSADGWFCRECDWQMTGGVMTSFEYIQKKHDRDRGITSIRFERQVTEWLPVPSEGVES